MRRTIDITSTHIDETSQSTEHKRRYFTLGELRRFLGAAEQFPDDSQVLAARVTGGHVRLTCTFEDED